MTGVEQLKFVEAHKLNPEIIYIAYVVSCKLVDGKDTIDKITDKVVSVYYNVGGNIEDVVNKSVEMLRDNPNLTDKEIIGRLTQ